MPYFVAVHNLCKTSTILPLKIKSLLGLGLNFCSRPKFSNNTSDIQLTRFQRDLYTRIYFGDSPMAKEETGLFLRSNWQPDSQDIPVEFKARVSFLRNKSTLCFEKDYKQHQVSFHLNMLHIIGCVITQIL